MTGGPLRLGGRATLVDGSRLLWTVADGRRGRRWRSIRSGPVGFERSILIETTTAGELARLEVAEAGGLLTVHPDDSMTTLHGNLVGPDGVRHLALPWSPAHVVIALDEPLLVAIALVGLGGGPAADLPQRRPGAVLRPGPDIAAGAALEVTVEGTSAWGLTMAGSPAVVVELDAGGLVRLADEDRWPLER